MKKLFFALVLLFSVVSFAQNSNRFDPKFKEAEKAFDSIVSHEKIQIAAREAARKTNKQLANEIAALQDVSGLRKIYAPLANPQASSKDVKHNHKLIPVLLKEFYDGARFYRLDYGKQISKLEEIYLVKGPLSFVGEVSENGSTIYLNEELDNYPNLMRIILFRQFGKIYGLKNDKRYGHAIMGEHWEIDLQHEVHAINLRARPTQKRNFFEALQKNHGLKKQI